MTPKTTVTIRVSPDTRQALDRLAAAADTNVSRLAGRVLDEWVAQQGAPIEQQGWYRAGALAAKARDYVHAAAKSKINRDASIISAIMHLADAIDVLNGTGDPAGGQ